MAPWAFVPSGCSVCSGWFSSAVSLADRSHPPVLTDRGDGKRDGWTRVRPEGPRSREVRLSIVILSPQSVQPQDWTLLYSPHPLVAVSLPDIRYREDSVFVSSEYEAGVLTYDVKCEVQSEASLTGSGEARIDDARYLQLPNGATMDEIRTLAASA